MGSTKTVGTLPAFAAASPTSERSRTALIAGVAFVEGVAVGWGPAELTLWFDEHLLTPGRLARANVVHEAVVGTIGLRNPEVGRDGANPAPARPSARGFAPLSQLPKLLAVARSRVVVSLRGLVRRSTDDRFLHSAIHNGRVQRTNIAGQNVWVARPGEHDLLSDIVLSLFAVDILMHRSFHDRALCVCEVCGRVSFHPEETGRNGCYEHPKGPQGDSGVRLKR